MKAVLPLLAILFAAAQSVFAQITVECAFDQKAYLYGEKLMVAVKVLNQSGRTLPLGATPDWLVLSVEASDNFIVRQLGNAPVDGAFEVPNTKVGIRRVDISPYYELSKPGRYSVVATVKIPGWPKTLVSKPATFDIVSGSQLWHTTFGVPGSEKDGQPEIRRYSLSKAHHGRDMMLYCRISDANGGRTLKVLPVARMVSFTTPEVQLDQHSNLHLLHQTGARSFNYSVISPDGETIKQELHEYTSSRPTLRRKADGELTVAGGQKRVKVANPPAEPGPDEPAEALSPDSEPKNEVEQPK